MGGFFLGRGLTLPDIRPSLQNTRGGQVAGAISWPVTLKLIQCLNLVNPERSPEALKVADARAGLRSFQGCDPALLEIVFSVPADQFRWFRLVLRRKAKRYDRQKSALQSSVNLNLPRS